VSKILSNEARRLLDAPNIAHLTTLMEDGSPKAEPVWIGRDDNRVFICTDRKSIKAKNLERDPRVAISITEFANPYEQLLIRGRVVETRDDSDLRMLDEQAEKYIGGPFPRRKWTSRVVYFIEIDVARYYLSPLKHTPGGRD
jgi:PPOX class probable F420-dependent enzyme